jgi:hypothetical protein
MMGILQVVLFYLLIEVMAITMEIIQAFDLF